MFKRKSTIVKAIKVLAVLTFLVFAYAMSRASLFLGETRMVDFTGLFQTLFSYLIAVVLAVLVGIYFSTYPGFRGIKVLSILLTIMYLYFIISLPFTIGDTVNWTPPYLSFVLFIFLPGLILSIWTMIYFKKMDQNRSISGKQEKQ